MKKILFTSLILLFGLGLWGQTALIKLNLEKNKPYRLRLSSGQTTSQTVNGNQQTTESKTTYSMVIKMLDKTADFIVAEVRFDTIITNANAMGKNTLISSARPGDIASSDAGEIMSYVMNKLSSNAIYVKIGFTGKPVEIVNQKVLNDMIARDTALVTLKAPMKNAITAQIINTVSSNSLLEMIGSLTGNLPGREVAAGEKWSDSRQTVSGGMMLDINTNYNLTAINAGTAVISAESDIRASKNAVPIKSGPATVGYDNLAGMSRSTITVDTNTGLPVSNSSKTRISGTLSISYPGGSMQMPMDINSESTVTTVR